ncbi:MAG: Re/Si-specific NAD(P)(+) transhydrogenase subunit alpha [Nitrospiria bacterium]
MIIAVPKEIAPGEARVALTPDVVKRLIKKGLEVHVQSGAGLGACMPDGDYAAVGAKMISDARSALAEADLIVKIHRPMTHEDSGEHEIDFMKEGSILMALLQPLAHPKTIIQLAERKVSAISMELIPRITRAQQMDILSSMSSVAGYKAVLLAASAFGRFFPMMTTAAGSLPPAKVLIIGAGVAGLQAIATAKRLGAMVEAFDTRPAVKEQVQSLGATFVELELEGEAGEDAGGYAKSLSESSHQKELTLIYEHAKTADIIITTALVPGKQAPRLITAEMTRDMKKGSVIVDLAAVQGGNCELTQVGREIVADGITIIGAVDLAASMPIHASQMFAKNMSQLILHLYRDNTFHIDLNDEITQGALVTHQGQIVNDAVQSAI